MTAPSAYGAYIPALPERLRFVPDLRDRYDDSSRQKWLAWKDAILDYRLLVLAQMQSDPDVEDAVLRLCADDSAYALIILGSIHEPRLRGGRGGTAPFIPFGAQVRIIRWFEGIMAEDIGDGYMSKSRSFGATWIFCWLAVWGWMFAETWDAFLVSRVGDQVDKKNEKKSMFYKIDFFLQNMDPALFEKLVPGFDWDEHRNPRILYNPHNGNSVSGDATTIKAGRGGRATFMLYDEANFIPDFDLVWGTGAGTTDHRFAISTESADEGGLFTRMWQLAKISTPNKVIEIEWWHNPYMDEKWYEESRERAKADGQLAAWEREYGRDMMAGMGSFIYEYSRAVVPKPLSYEPGFGRRLYCCVDPGLLDDTALVWIQYDPGTDTHKVLDAYMRSSMDSGYYASIMTGIPVSGIYDYDYDALDIMRWTSTIRDPIVYVGDPYGTNRGGAVGPTFYEGIAQKSKELTGVAIHVMVSWEPEDRGLEGRHEALRELLPKMEFNDTERVRRLLASMQDYKYKAPREGRDTTAAVRQPLRIPGDHMITAVEFYAVHRRIGQFAERVKRAKPLKQIFRREQAVQ